MELGEKLRTARMEAGMTQKQLCEGLVTRNMLSQIENGSARPSMGTLSEMAKRLGKSIGFFLGEEAEASPNTLRMYRARELFDGGSWEEALAALEGYQAPDGIHDRERQLLEAECLMKLGEKAIAEGRDRYAEELLDRLPPQTAYCAGEVARRKLLLLGKLGRRVSRELPGLDEELLLRAEEAPAPERKAALLDACEDQESPRWNLARGKLWMARRDYEAAKACLLLAEAGYPKETAPLLEECFRELGDYKGAYLYACRQKR